MNFKIENNDIYLTRQGEIARLSVRGENSIRFQATPNCHIEDVNWTLMPQNYRACAHIGDNRAILETGDMRAEIYHRTGEQYMFGDDILFAPIVNQGQTEKEV